MRRLLAITLLIPACAATRAPDTPASMVPEARDHVVRFFGAPYPHDFEVRIVADRAAFADLTERRWGFRAEPCWMVAVGTGSIFAMIDPTAWPTDACEHDPDDEEHVRRVVTHELVHVYHGQHNADPEFDTMEPMGWFVEGLAVYASGQFDDRRRAQAAAAAIDAWPERLDTAWTGEARYAVCGAIVAWIDGAYGRGTLVELLGAGTTAEALGVLGVEEPALLERVRSSLRGGVSGGS